MFLALGQLFEGFLVSLGASRQVSPPPGVSWGCIQSLSKASWCPKKRPWGAKTIEKHVFFALEPPATGFPGLLGASHGLPASPGACLGLSQSISGPPGAILRASLGPPKLVNMSETTQQKIHDFCSAGTLRRFTGVSRSFQRGFSTS